MNTQEVLNLIKESFEGWYNKVYSTKVSIVINYSETQALAIKAYRTITMEVQAISIENGVSKAASLIKLTENYNHGVTTEDEAKLGLTKKMLMEMFSYQVSMMWFCCYDIATHLTKGRLNGLLFFCIYISEKFTDLYAFLFLFIFAEK